MYCVPDAGSHAESRLRLRSVSASSSKGSPSELLDAGRKAEPRAEATITWEKGLGRRICVSPHRTLKMKTLLLLAVIMAFALLQVHAHLWDFARMIKHTTGKGALLSYSAYGCYCGVSGRGSPKDATDWCCWEHDCCYKKLKHHGCGTKFLNYNVSIRRGQITCGKSKSYRLHPASSALFPVFACQAPELDTKGQVSASRGSQLSGK
uniref:Phospholipase A2 n=1 Tax=Bos mutus grunniens TaxID=30521 RepID=A0A8B9WNC9_BOSMU